MDCYWDMRTPLENLEDAAFVVVEVFDADKEKAAAGPSLCLRLRLDREKLHSQATTRNVHVQRRAPGLQPDDRAEAEDAPFDGALSSLQMDVELHCRAAWRHGAVSVTDVATALFALDTQKDPGGSTQTET